MFSSTGRFSGRAASAPPKGALLAKLLPDGPANTRWRASKAAQNVVPVAVTAGDNIEALRQWASGRCLSVDRAGVYSRSEGSGRVRRVVRELVVN